MLSIVRKRASRVGCDDVDQWIRLSDWRSVKPSRYDGKRSEESNANGLRPAGNSKRLFAAAPEAPKSRMLPSVIGGPGGCLGFIR
jgi:hypothetical protein